jgi:hypothetical protein
MSDEQLDAWCRKHGLHTHHLKQWKDDAIAGCLAPRTGKSQRERRALGKDGQVPEKELSRKEKALAETAALLVLKKRPNQFGGSPEDD